jgi:long-chain acyl-CoA synthetase
MTIPQLFEQSVNHFPENPLIWEKKDEQQGYTSMTYRQMKELVEKFAAGLLSWGLQKGDRVGLISEGRNEWLLSELSILYTGAINVPISVKIDEASDLKFRLSHSGCRIVIVSKAHAHKIEKIKSDLPDLDLVIHLDPPAKEEPDEMSLHKLMNQGQEYLKSNRPDFENAWKTIMPNDPANICYTSGTTADPKGIILSHRNYTANVEQASALYEIPEYYVSLLILPWDHSFGHTTGIYALMKNGASMASVQSGNSLLETLRNIPRNIREIKPHFLLSVPALAKNFRKNIEKEISKKGPTIEKMFQHALQTAYSYNRLGYDKGKGFHLHNRLMLKLYDKLIFSKIREQFGGRLKFFVGGGALLDLDLQRFFYALGIPMFQGYGLSEASPVISANSPDVHKLGSSGKLVPNLELRIVDENDQSLPAGEKGEIVVKGENVMLGYWRNEKSTSETIKDGWLYTGDLGYVDAEGYLYVMGRFKSLLIGNDGEKFSPEAIEEALVEHSPYIEQVMLYNNQNPYTVGLIVPNKEAIAGYVREHQLDLHQQSGQDKIIALLVNEIEQFSGGGKMAGLFPERWLPASVAILGEGFTEQNRLLNSTLKMVRGKITEFYQNRLDYMYTAEGKNVYNHQNRTILNRMFLLEEKLT